MRRVASIWVVASLMFWALAGVCAAADAAAPASAQTGKLPGLISGLLLLALFGYSIYIYTAPLLKDRDPSIVWALAILCVVAIVKLALLPWFDGYKNDISSYESWALQMASQGPAGIYRAGYFLDYPPGYLYALWLMGIVANATGAGGVMLRMTVEAPAMVADFVLALLVFVFVRRTAPARRTAAYAAMLLVALNPALGFDTIIWGQSDSALTVVIMLSAALALDGEFELAWALAALSVLVKPQALMYVPVLGLWTLIKLPYSQWWRPALAAGTVFVVGVLPFQLGHPWYWILELYHSTAAYYHETSVNAFNLIALIGGLRKPDTDTFAGLSYFSLGMGLLVPLYAFIGWRLWNERSARGMMFAIFAAVFGFFMLAPRMHERYLYAGLVFAAPLVVEGAEMATVFAILTATCLFNLAYVLHVLDTTIFLDSRDGLAMLASAINVVALALAIDYGLGLAEGEGPLWRWLASLGRRLDGGSADARSRQRAASKDAASIERAPEPLIAIPWLRIDTIVLGALVAAAAATRLWHLGLPAEIVFDEVHFVAQARHYIRGEPFLDPHPPLAKLVIAAGIVLFGDHPWSWRIGNALLGILLVALTYMLGRRMFASRLAGALAASFVICDGMFLVDSRVAVIDIVYLTLAAWSYLLLFRFAESSDHRDRRRTLAAMGVTLGLCLGSKLYVPAITFLLCAGLHGLVHHGRRASRAAGGADSARGRRAADGGIAQCRVLHRGVPAAFLPWMVGGNRGSASLLQRRDVVRGQRQGRDPSVLLAMVDVAADAAADRVLAELSAAGQGRDDLGRRKSTAMVERAHRDHDHRRARAGAAEPGAYVPRVRLPQLSRDVDAGWAHAVPVSLHAVGLPGLPGAGGDRRGRVAGRGRDVGMCRAARNDDSGLHAGTRVLGGTVPEHGAGAAGDIYDRRRDCSRGRSRFGGSAMGAAADRRRVCDRGGDPVRLLLSDLDRNFDRSRGLLQPDVAAGAGAAQLDLSICA